MNEKLLSELRNCSQLPREALPDLCRDAADRIAALEARLAASTGREQGKQMVIAQLEAALLEAREWIETDTDALDECHKPYDLDNPIDVEAAQEVDDRRTWLTRTASETGTDQSIKGNDDGR